MADLPSKQALKDELLGMLKDELDVLARAHKATTEGATHEEARPENDKDTRALEQSYLARGQAMRVKQLLAGVADLQSMRLRAFQDDDPVALGALVTVQQQDSRRAYLLAPQGGGCSLADGKVQVITPSSPLGRALLGKRVGDDCVLMLAGSIRELVVLFVE